MVIATGFIPLLALSVVPTMVMWESSRWVEKNIEQSFGKKNFRKGWIGALAIVTLESSPWVRKNIEQSFSKKNCRKGWIGALYVVL